MTTRGLTITLIIVACLLVLTWAARNFLADMRCDGLGMIYEAGKGCIEPPRGPPIILERGLKRT